MKLTVAALPLAFLAGCKPTAEPIPQESPSSRVVLNGATPTSIIRPDIAAPVDQNQPLEPLTVVIGFADGGAELSPSELEKLEKLLASPQVKQEGAITLGAHSDSAGTDAANLIASRKRGIAVRDWLVDKGIPEDRITLVAFGEQNPVRPNARPDGKPDEAGRAANRRVEVRVSVANQSAEEPRVPTLAEEIVERTESENPTPRISEKNN